jgi:hypothetical protein
MEHVVGANVAEIIRVVARLEDVVVALDEHLIPVEAPQNGKRSPVYNHISEVIDLVLGADNVVPVFDKDLVHLSQGLILEPSSLRNLHTPAWPKWVSLIRNVFIECVFMGYWLPGIPASKLP